MSTDRLALAVLWTLERGPLRDELGAGEVVVTGDAQAALGMLLTGSGIERGSMSVGDMHPPSLSPLGAGAEIGQATQPHPEAPRLAALAAAPAATTNPKVTRAPSTPGDMVEVPLDPDSPVCRPPGALISAALPPGVGPATWREWALRLVGPGCEVLAHGCGEARIKPTDATWRLLAEVTVL